MEGPRPDHPTFYDVRFDEMRYIRQEDVDGMLDILNAMIEPVGAHQEVPSTQEFTFKLACYPNRMRAGESFVAEDKAITPYQGISDLFGRPLYPATPDTPWKLGRSFPTEFAQELVRRWNRGT